MGARSVQFGGGPIGTVNLAAGGENPLSFLNMPDGPMTGFDLSLGVTIKSTGSSFAAVVDTGSSMAAEGVDDIDLLTAAVYSKLNYFWDDTETAFNMGPASIRTVLAFFELRDIISTLLNGGTIPASGSGAATFTFDFYVPVQLNHLIRDGNLFANGSERLKNGTLFLNTNNSITPNVVLANGTAAISANIVRAVARGGTGDAGDVGNVWTALRTLGLPTTYNFTLDRPRLALLDVEPVASNDASGISIGPYEPLNPSDFGNVFTGVKLAAFGNAANILARVTPYIYPDPGSTVDDMVARLLQGKPRMQIASGVSSFGVYDIQVIEPDAATHQQVATQVGGGGAVDTAPVKPHSVPVGTKVPAQIATFLPRRIAPPGQLGSVATKVASAGQAGTNAAKRTSNNQTLLSLAKSRR